MSRFQGHSGRCPPLWCGLWFVIDFTPTQWRGQRDETSESKSRCLGPWQPRVKSVSSARTSSEDAFLHFL